MPDETFPKEAETFLEETNYFFTTKKFLDQLSPFYSILPKLNDPVIFCGPSSDGVGWLLGLKSGECIQVIPQDIRCLEVPRIYDMRGTLIPQLSFPNRAIKTEGIVDVPLYLRDIDGKVMRLFQVNNTPAHTKYSYVFPDGMIRVVDDIYQFDTGDVMEWLDEYCKNWNIGGIVSKLKKPDEAVEWLKENEAFKAKLEEANMSDVNNYLISDKSSATEPAGLLPTKPAEDQQEMEQVYIVKHDIPAGGFVSESLKKGDILIPVPVEHATLTYARYPSGKVFNVDPMNIETISRPKTTALVVVEKEHKRPAKDIVGFRSILKNATDPSTMFGWAYDYRGDRYWSMITPSGKPELGVLAGTAPFEPIYRDELSECAQRAYYSTIGVCGFRLLRVARDGTEDFISITNPTSPLLNDPTIVLDGEVFTHPELEPRYLKAVQYPYMDQLCKKGGIFLYRVLEDIRDIDDADIHWPAGTILFRFADMPTEDGINILTLMDSARNTTRIPAESVEKASGAPMIKVESSLMDKLKRIFTSKSMRAPKWRD